MIYDSVEKSHEIIENPFVSSFDGSGIQTSQILIKKCCDVLIVREISRQAVLFLESMGMEVYLYSKGNVEDAIRLYNSGLLERRE